MSVGKNIEFEGKLKNKDGYVYLKLPDEIISIFSSMISAPLSDPKKASDKWVGCHISVIHKDETDQNIKEVGKNFKFTITGAKYLKPEGWDEVSNVYFITVDSPELEKLREKYNLSKKYKGHDFHITIGVIIKKEAKQNWYNKMNKQN